MVRILSRNKEETCHVDIFKTIFCNDFIIQGNDDTMPHRFYACYRDKVIMITLLLFIVTITLS